MHQLIRTRVRADCVLRSNEDCCIYAGSSPVSAVNCTFADSKGAALKSFLSSKIRVEGCTFRDNEADLYAESAAQSVYASDHKELTLAPGSLARPQPLDAAAAAVGPAFLYGNSTNFAALREVRSAVVPAAHAALNDVQASGGCSCCALQM